MKTLLGVVVSLLAVSSASAQEAQPLYPDLVSWAQPGRYLYDAEVAFAGGRRLLRFSAAPANRGRGPFELWGQVQADGTTTAYQRVYNDDGTHADRYAGTFTFAGHADHSHFHYAAFAAYRLRDVAAGGGAGAVQRVSGKVGFAMWDVAAYDLALPGAPRRPVYQRPEGTSTAPEGISVGWADVYDKALADQDIDITGLADGTYWLEMETDPEGRLLESDEANNTTRIRIHLEGDRVAILPGGEPEPVPPAVAGTEFRPYPNPWRGDWHKGLPLRFAPLPAGGSVRIYSLGGRRLKTIPTGRGEAFWDLTDETGGAVGTGYYLFTVTEPGGGERRGAIAIIR
ncbi:MAG: hypothetical protein HY554_12015 [Elusimicrobia bacterium]|nr:hypothetical protein [Elusimicrobiota bacterium]